MKRFVCILLAAACLLCACTPEKPAQTEEGTVDNMTEDNKDTTSGSLNTTVETDELTGEQTSEPTADAPECTACADTDEVIYAADYGAVGDGTTDDGPALTQALYAAMRKRGTLKLQEGKTYYVATSSNTTNGFVSPFAVEGKKNFTVDGCGATISVKPGITYIAAVSCENIVFKNLNFKYDIPIYMVGTVTAVKGAKVTYSTDIEPNADSCEFGGIGFSIKYNEGIQNRPHQFFSKMVKTDSKTVEVTYNAAGGYSMGDKVFLPNPYIGHMIGEVFYFSGTKGQLYLENINVYSAPSFIFAIKGNPGDVVMNNVDIVPEPDTGREIEMVSWRDGYHCKDNRGRLIWYECDTGVIFDDVCNISCTLGAVLSIPSETQIEVTNQEFYAYQNRIVGYDCEVGDVVDVYSPSKTKYAGRATVTEIKKNSSGSLTITLDTPLSDVTTDYVVGNLMTAAPGSLMENCRATGTFRFRGAATIRNCEFDILIIWIMVEGDVEGPIPQNIVFENCVLNDGSIEIDAMDRNTNRYSKAIAKMITGIKFINCTITSKFTSKLRIEYEVS